MAQQRLATWLSERKMLACTVGWNAFLESKNDYDSESFRAGIAALSSLTNQPEAALNSLTEMYETLKDCIRTELEVCFLKFCYCLQNTFEFKQAYKPIMKKERILGELLATMKMDFVEKGLFKEIVTYWKLIKEFVIGLQTREKVKDLNNTVKGFFADQSREISKHLEKFLFQQFDNVLSEFSSVIAQLAAHNSELCSVKTWAISLSDTNSRPEGGKSFFTLQPSIQSRYFCDWRNCIGSCPGSQSNRSIFPLR